MTKRIVVAMSGGVDSAVSAYLLKQAGYEVVGLTMRLYTQEDPTALPAQRRCCGIEDVDDARRVCQLLGIPHYYFNFEREFKVGVVDYFIREYQQGRTPHPCIACNDKIKFDSLLHRALAWDADLVATGHYARIAHWGGTSRLLKALDQGKDQSYVLYNLRQEQLQRILFPVGELTKPQVRQIAREMGFPVADKPDSQEVCFIPTGNYRSFLQAHGSHQPGDIVTTAGEVLGRHPGIAFFTVGQRKGLGLTSPTPYYVIRLDSQRNQVVVGKEDELLSGSCLAAHVNFISGEVSSSPLPVTAKIRYKTPEAEAVLYPQGDSVELRFRIPQRAVTPGQAIVFYQGQEVLGGGVIVSTKGFPSDDIHGPLLEAL